MKPTPCSKVLQSQHGHSGFQDLILFLKPLRGVAALIIIRITFQINAPKSLMEFLPLNSVLTKDICKVYLSLKSNKVLKSPTNSSPETLHISVAKRCIFRSYYDRYYEKKRSHMYF